MTKLALPSTAFSVVPNEVGTGDENAGADPTCAVSVVICACKSEMVDALRTFDAVAASRVLCNAERFPFKPDVQEAKVGSKLREVVEFSLCKIHEG